MYNGDTPHNGKSEACTSCLTRTGLVHAVEAFAQMRQVLGGHTDSSVLHLQERLFIFYRCAHCDTTTPPIVLDGVVEQREDGLFELCRIANHHRFLVGFYLHIDLCLICHGLHAPHSRESHVSEVQHLMFSVGGAAVKKKKS